jgi:GTP:adenosylcobinamide-phosphate guanylyltransferase
MSGGMAKRLGGAEKGAIEICGKTVISRILEEVKRISKEIFLICTSRCRKTIEEARKYDVQVILREGRSYEEDVKWVIDNFDEGVIINGDMPFIKKERVLIFYYLCKEMPCSFITLALNEEGKALISKELKLKVSASGISCFKRGKDCWQTVVTGYSIDLFNLNTLDELIFAREKCRELTEDFGRGEDLRT